MTSRPSSSPSVSACPHIVAEIDAWDRQWQEIYREDDPRESGFAGERAMLSRYERGLRVAHRLASALGSGVAVETVKTGGGFLVVGSASEVSYFGSVPPGRTGGRLGGVFRRSIVDGQPVDEAFTRNLRWEPTSAPRERDLGYGDTDYVEVSETEVDAFVQRARQRRST